MSIDFVKLLYPLICNAVKMERRGDPLVKTQIIINKLEV